MRGKKTVAPAPVEKSSVEQARAAYEKFNDSVHTLESLQGNFDSSYYTDQLPRLFVTNDDGVEKSTTALEVLESLQEEINLEIKNEQAIIASRNAPRGRSVAIMLKDDVFDGSIKECRGLCLEIRDNLRDNNTLLSPKDLELLSSAESSLSSLLQLQGLQHTFTHDVAGENLKNIEDISVILKQISSAQEYPPKYSEQPENQSSQSSLFCFHEGTGQASSSAGQEYIPSSDGTCEL